MAVHLQGFTVIITCVLLMQGGPPAGYNPQGAPPTAPPSGYAGAPPGGQYGGAPGYAPSGPPPQGYAGNRPPPAGMEQHFLKG